MTRTSGGKYLEILESAPALAVPIEVDVFNGADPATMLATLDGATGKRFTRELSELGSGGFVVARHDPKATAANLAVGNLVKFGVGGVYRHAVWIEEPATTLVSTGEEGGEAVKVDGRGVLAYIERSAVYPPVWPVAAALVVASASADNGAGTTSLAVPKPAGTAAGDVVVAAILCVGVTPSTPTGWTRIRNTTNGTLRLAVYRKRILASEPATWTWTWSAATKATGAATTLRNASDDDTAWSISDTTGSGTAVEEPSVSVGLVDGVLLGLAASAAATTFTPPAGMTEAVDRSATGRTLEVATLVNPALGETGDLPATAGSSAAWIGVQLWVPSTASADAVFDGATFGAILSTLIDEAQGRGELPAMTYDFTGAVDSHGEPWPDVHDITFHVGTNLLEVWRHLVTLGLEGGMTPSLRLRAFVDVSRHFEATVVLRKGHHFTGDVIDAAHGAGLRTRYLVEGAGGRVVEVTDPAMEADAHIGRRVGYLSLSTSDNPTTLQRAGEIALASSSAEDEARWVKVDHGTAAQGLYEPWADYAEGDWIGLDADGTGGAPTAERVVSITLVETEAGDFETEIELNSPELDAFLRLQRRMDALTRQTTASGSGGSGGGGSAGGAKVATVSTDTPGYLNDKLTVDSSLTRTLVGDVGSQRVQLGVAPGGTHPSLATHDAMGLATDAELAAQLAAYAQPLDSDLTALAGLAVAADTLPYGTGSHTMALTPLTAAGRALIDDVDAAAQRTTLGLGTAATTASTAYEATGAVATHAGLADPHTGYQRESEKGAVSGYASLGAGGLVPMAQLASGTPDGTKFLRDDGTLAAAAGGGMTNPMTTAADLIVGGTAGAPARLAKGADGTLLTVDPTTHLLVWAPIPAGAISGSKISAGAVTADKIAPGEFPSRNLLRNGGFRAGLTGWGVDSGGAPGFNAGLWGTSDASWTLRDHDIDNAAPAGPWGSTAFMAGTTVADTFYPSLYQVVNVMPSEWYSLSMLFGTHRLAGAYAYLAWRTSAGVTIRTDNFSVTDLSKMGGPTAAGYSHVTGVVQAPETAADVIVGLRAVTPGTDWYLFMDQAWFGVGKYPQRYQPAEADSARNTTGTVVIDSSGVTVTNGTMSLLGGLGWGAPTGTATRTTFASATVTLAQLAERVKALIDDLA